MIVVSASTELPKIDFGETYGGDDVAYQHGDTGLELLMYRKSQKVRFYDAATHEQVGPEHTNVAPAVAWAYHNGYFSPSLARAGIFRTGR